MLHDLKYFFEFNKFDDTIWNAVDVDKFFIEKLSELERKCFLLIDLNSRHKAIDGKWLPLAR